MAAKINSGLWALEANDYSQAFDEKPIGFDENSLNKIC